MILELDNTQFILSKDFEFENILFFSTVIKVFQIQHLATFLNKNLLFDVRYVFHFNNDNVVLQFHLTKEEYNKLKLFCR